MNFQKDNAILLYLWKAFQMSSNYFLLHRHFNRPFQRRERTGKEYGCFPFFFEKLRYSNERSTKFESLNHE